MNSITFALGFFSIEPNNEIMLLRLTVQALAEWLIPNTSGSIPHIIKGDLEYASSVSSLQIWKEAAELKNAELISWEKGSTASYWEFQLKVNLSVIHEILKLLIPLIYAIEDSSFATILSTCGIPQKSISLYT